ncbi:undecaprenyldiphospho-muramoylpentapeptide beta-N-acetylglucosaminyltransferase [Sinanaerobacter chloroacetimidivorans]|uniref:UDP-N-acetylglucosamine--N-acetylmuramyl-(pentapeptide) pyrophosphoryl-undecaprenol N-acetylglucosamine transferase n=1 Tax=Sinanaerobacter chloroacetimidivorans TaxID=2818044 RepID=A0A8J7VYG7_9FIRM|nr:undecaprenyldiphospho-muramoylpentapeptide beta-N-acetylglucosaminyltransferase [Sinanaerobacter chloroacetimidivorans]MBR0597064.1 undecaprenyldiphospho-muramoylpentapeptide beta-N-acetylglucosaminyltransferase [Sinanaerobacter chloroacetimidivorans]
MKVIMTGGGTGGHIYPAIAIADKIKRKHPDAEILFIGTEKGMEKDLVPKNGYDIKFITVSGFHRKKLWKNVKTARDLIKSNRQTKKILEEFRPDLVIGTGGYVCGPVVRLAHKMGIKTFIHEQNAFPGVTNKLLEKYVDKVFVSFSESKEYFKDADKLVVTGNPIRKSFFISSGNTSREKLKIKPSEFVILCFGGSLGAGKINSTMVGVVEALNQIPDLKLFFITGKIYYERICNALQEKGIQSSEHINIMEYADNMHEYLSAADLVISRAGALTVSEITACGKPSILIPSPNVTGNHQYFNAKVVADKGGAVIIEEKDLTEEKLIGILMRLKNNKEVLNGMAKASEKIGRIDAVDMIYDHLGI